MARDFSARKRRSKPFLPPQQRVLSQFFTPRSGISKNDVNYFVKPLDKVDETSNLGFKEVNIKQQPVSVGPGSMHQVTTGFATAWELQQQNWRHECNSTGQCNKGSVYEKSTTLSGLNYQPADVDLAINTDSLTSVHSRDLCKQTVKTRESLMASKLRASSSSRSVSVENSASSWTSTRKDDKRVRKLTSGSKWYERSVKKQKSEHLSTVSGEMGDGTSEDDDDDCCIVNVSHGSEAKNAIQVDTESSDSGNGETNCTCQSSKTSSNHAVTQSSSESTSCDSSSVSASQSRSTGSSTSSDSFPQVPKKKVTHSTFGLTGADSSESDTDVDESSASFDCLPVEIMENIFCQLPVVDLLFNCVLVCHQWHDVISSELRETVQFIPWKKKYFQLKSRVSTCEDEMVKLVDEEQLLELDLFPLHLGRFMGNFRRSRDAIVLQESLKKHSKFHLIETFLETLTEGPDKKPSPWSVVSLLTLVSVTVYDVQEIVRCLVKSNSCLVQDILECFYCLASIFFLLETQHRIGSGPHYRVFYTLYLFENAFQATRASIGSVFQRNETGQQSLMKYRSSSDRLQLTHEQVRITKHDISPGEIIKIVAFAGTGKTTTLVEYTKMRPMKKFLNVAYNKSIQEHAEKLFPRNVESRTVHSLAYRAKGFQYRHKLAPCLRLSAIMNALPDKCGFLYARRVEDTLKNFIASTSSVVEAKHVPPVTSSAVMLSFGDTSDVVETIFGNHGADLSYLSGEKHINKVLSHAEMLWQRMKDLGDKDIPITHDGYLKLYQLSRPVLRGYDCLLIDEAQDCTPAAADVLLRQNCAKILVGDPHQQIYAFRGAKNALQEVTSTHTFYLTQSFRFGPEIAYVAACVLDVLKGVRNKTLVGGAKPGSVLGGRKGQLCVITRCNYTLFNEAVQVCCSRNETRVAFVGGIRGLALDRILDIHRLFTAGTNDGSLYIKDNLIRKFRTFSELKKYAKVATDAELMGKIKIVETHHVMLQQRIEKIKSKTCHEIQQADIVFSTAHKAKGLEFETVRLTDDFLAATDIGVSIHDHQEDDKNLVYVAVSRAKKCLQLTPTLLRILAEKKEHFLKVVSSKQTNQGEKAFLCASCKQNSDVLSKDAHIFVQKEEVVLGGNIRMPGGTLCPLCAFNQMPQLGCLVDSTRVNTDQSASM